MKKLLIFSIVNLLLSSLSAQNVYTITADSVKLTSCDSSELIIENHTQGVPGFLYNTGKGRTAFRRALTKINDTLYLVGADTLKIRTPLAWLQGGNAFGATGILGTTDNNPLDLYTNNVARARLTTTGDLLLGASVDSAYKLDVKGPVRLGTHLGQSMIRGSLNFDNGVNATYIMEQNSTLRSLQIPGTGGNAPWVFRNTADWGLQMIDASGTVALRAGTLNIVSPNFSNIGSIIATEPSAPNNRTVYIGNTTHQYANENGSNIDIRGGQGGYLPTSYLFNGGNIMINGGLAPLGSNGAILLGGRVPGNVGIQTSTPVSNFQVDQSSAGSGVLITAAGGTTITGKGTQFTNTFNPGDSLTVDGQTVRIAAIASDLSLTTSQPLNLTDTNAVYTLTGGSRFHVKGNGTVGVGVAAPTSQMDILAPKGYAQFRLRTSYTPTSSSDTNGNTGDFSWDGNYFYVKTPGGWKRSALTSF